MKQFIVNTLSTTLSAAVVVGATVFAAAPAKADTADVIKGLMAGIILVEIANQNRRTHEPQHTRQTQNINNRVDPRRECDVQYRRGTGYNTWERISYNCLGQIIETRTVK